MPPRRRSGRRCRAVWPVVLALAIAALLQFVLAPRINAFYSDILINSGIAIILAVSLTAINGFTGQFSIGHAGFMSLGGYMAVAIVYYGSFHFFGDADFHGGRLSYTGGNVFDGTFLGRGDALFLAPAWPARFSPPSSGGSLACRAALRGDYLAIVTLGFGEIVRVILQGSQDQLDATSTDPAIGDVPFYQQLTHLGGALGFSEHRPTRLFSGCGRRPSSQSRRRSGLNTPVTEGRCSPSVKMKSPPAPPG